MLTPNTRCANCNDVGKHLSRDCPVKCNKCGLNFCPGARSQLCAVECLLKPSTRELKNGRGFDLHEVMVKKLDKAWAAKHGTEVSMLELTTLPSGSRRRRRRGRRRLRHLRPRCSAPTRSEHSTRAPERRIVVACEAVVPWLWRRVAGTSAPRGLSREMSHGCGAGWPAPQPPGGT